MRKLVKTIFSGEFAFTIFLIGAVFKESLPFQMIDLTILFLGISIVILVKRLLFKPELKKSQLLPVVWYTLMIGIFLLSFLFSDSTIYGLDKLMRFVGITGFAFYGAVLIISDRVKLKRFIDSFIIITVACAVVIVFSPTDNAVGFKGLADDNYLGSARLLGMGTIMLLAYNLYGDFTKRTKLILFVSLLLSITALFSTGARMPAISTLVVFSFLLLKTIKFNKGHLVFRKGTLKIIGLTLMLVAGMYALRDSTIFQTTLSRLNVLFNSSSGGKSAGDRLRYFEAAIEMFKENPIFGVGLGGFGINYTGIDQRYYPHNIFLEFLSETGLIGFLLFSFVLVVALKRVFKSFRQTDYLSITISSTFIFMLINVMSSGDFNDNRTFFTFLGLSLMLPVFIKERVYSPERSEKSVGPVTKSKRRFKRYKFVW